MKPKERLIVALDVDTLEGALELVETLSPVVDIFKVGIAPFTAFGHELLEKINELDKKVFLDLKVHDIPNTVRNAAYAAAKKGVFMMNFHCLGGESMLQAAAEGAEEAALRLHKPGPLLLGVTILTSMSQDDMQSIGITGSVEEKVLDLALKAYNAGLNGVVASAKEASSIKDKFGEKFIVVTPGIRPEWAAKGDQKRVLTPKEATMAGADYIVVGRPIIEADDPALAAEKIIKEIAG
ncbi:MAG: orotidine-5'-phosphate decarboxylase [Candidatus Omnitrophica bacterium]|nr:orotidine-5'-phosphate decarboxylase [Candidatus Omnitrophota bacterium]